MPVDEGPADDDLRQTYNFAPGYHGLVYRADVPDYGAGPHRNDHASAGTADGESAPIPAEPAEETRYKLQAMKWGRCSLCVVSSRFPVPLLTGNVRKVITLTIIRAGTILEQTQS